MALPPGPSLPPIAIVGLGGRLPTALEDHLGPPPGRRPVKPSLSRALAPTRARLLPHEAVFGVFLLAAWLRFGSGLLGREALPFPILLAVDGVLIAFCLQAPTPVRWRLRLSFHPLAAALVYLRLGATVSRLTAWRADGLLQRLDATLLGGNLSLRLQGWTRPVPTEALSVCYLLFFPYLLDSLRHHFQGDLPTLKAFLTGTFTLYGLGFLGYLLLPAVGPWVAMAGRFTVPLAGGPCTRFNEAWVRLGSNRVDAFPSLHCALTAFFLAFDFRHAPGRFRALLVPCLGLWFSTLYLRYHYGVDVLTGFALAVFALWLAHRQERTDGNGKKA